MSRSIRKVPGRPWDVCILDVPLKVTNNEGKGNNCNVLGSWAVLSAKGRAASMGTGAAKKYTGIWCTNKFHFTATGYQLVVDPSNPLALSNLNGYCVSKMGTGAYGISDACPTGVPASPPDVALPDFHTPLNPQETTARTQANLDAFCAGKASAQIPTTAPMAVKAPYLCCKDMNAIQSPSH